MNYVLIQALFKNHSKNTENDEPDYLAKIVTFISPITRTVNKMIYLIRKSITIIMSVISAKF